MRGTFAWALTLAPFAIVLAAFHFWGEHQRARQWWWVGGDSEGMSFVNLLDHQQGRGHLLFTEARGTTREPAQEIDIDWSCAEGTITLGEMWILDDRMQQIERRPPPPQPFRGPRSPNSGSEKSGLEVACATVEDRSQMRTVRIERAPIEMNRLAVRLMDAGIRPFDALFLASYDPSRDPEGFERLLARVPVGLRDRARKLSK